MMKFLIVLLGVIVIILLFPYNKQITDTNSTADFNGWTVGDTVRAVISDTAFSTLELDNALRNILLEFAATIYQDVASPNNIVKIQDNSITHRIDDAVKEIKDALRRFLPYK